MKMIDLMRSFRVIFGLLMLCVFSVGAHAQYYAEKTNQKVDKITQDVEKRSLSDVLEQIKDKKQVLFVYESRLVKDKIIMAQIDYDRDVEAILNEILPPIGLTYRKMRHSTFAIRSLAATQQSGAQQIQRLDPTASVARREVQQLSRSRQLDRMVAVASPLKVEEFTVTGTVRDDRGAPLEGTVIRHKEGISGAIASSGGKYSVSLPSGDVTLIVSFVGYKTQEIAVNNRPVIDIVMTEDIALLDEVIVVGYGSQVKREITGNISSVKGADLAKVPSISVDQGLQGMAAGVQVSSASGVAGAPVRVMVRGTSSISAGTEPLWVIDGMIIGDALTTGIRAVSGTEQNPLASINPNDIESIDILKDAAATAIYGSRGSNGVIIVTTKNGRQGRGQFNINYQTGVTSLTRHPDELMISSGSEWLSLIDQARTASGLSEQNVQQFVREDLYGQGEAIPQLSRAEAQAATAQWDEMLSTGSFQDINLSTSRGSEAGNYFISANYRDEKGVLWNDFLDNGNRFQRLSVRINADIKPLPSFTMGTRTTLSYINNQRVSPNGGGGPSGNDNIATPGFGALVGNRPIYPVMQGDGLFDPRSGNNFRATMNQENLRNQAYNYRALSGVFAQWEIPWVRGLSIRSEASADVQLNHGIFWGNTVIRENFTYAFDDQTTRFNYLFNAYAMYNRDLGKHTLQLTAGTERQITEGRNKYIEGQDLVGTAQEVGSPNQILRLGGFFNTDRNLLSYFGRANYSFDDRFLLGLSFRADAATPFLEEGLRVTPDTWGYFPAVSAGWVLSKEDFMSNASFINFLKLRASYGRTGNWGIPANLDVLSFANWGRYGSRAQNVNAGDLLNNVPAQGITWETTDSWDAGFDFELMNSRISGSIAYFLQDVSGLIIQVPIPPSSGTFTAGSIWANVGDLKNQGLEFSLTSYNINRNDFRWQTNVNFTWNTNEVTALTPVLDENQNGINTGITTTVAGGRLGEFFLARYAGLNEFGGYPMIYAIDLDPFLNDGVTANPNFRQETGEIIPATQNDVRFHKQRTGKSGLPTYFGGLNNTLSYKGIELSFQLAFQGGNWIFDDLERARTRIGGGGGNLYQALLTDSWTESNKDATHPRIVWNDRYDVYDESGNVSTANVRFDYRANEYHDQHLKRGDFVRLRTLQLAYDFPQAFAERLNINGLRVFATGTNLLTLTGYDGLDPEQAVLTGNRNLTQGIFGSALPPLRMFTGGLSLQF